MIATTEEEIAWCKDVIKNGYDAMGYPVSYTGDEVFFYCKSFVVVFTHKISEMYLSFDGDFSSTTGYISKFSSTSNMGSRREFKSVMSEIETFARNLGMSKLYASTTVDHAKAHSKITGWSIVSEEKYLPEVDRIAVLIKKDL